MFHLGQQSQERLEGLDPGLVKCVRRAITQTSVDFSVFEGMRSRQRQEQLFRQGVSRTLDSYHLTGHAVDLVPFIGGRLQWQTAACCQIAIAMREAALEFKVKLVWGAVWSKHLNDLDPVVLQSEVDKYVMEFKEKNPGRHPLIDYPHYQTAMR